MDAVTLSAIAAGAASVLFAVLWLVAGRRSRRRGRLAAALRSDLDLARSRSQAHAAGEREASWALRTTTEALAVTATALGEGDARIAALETDLDDLVARLAAADADLVAARREADDATTEIARLEGEVARLQVRLTAASEIATSGTDTSAGLDEVAELRDRIDRESAELGRLRAELAAARGAGAPDTDGGGTVHDRLVSSEARRRDLEDRLAALNAIRASEQRRAADQIAGLERLHLEIAERERRIHDLEVEIKETAESRDDALAEAARLQVELVRLKSALTTAEGRLRGLEDQQSALAAARERITQLESATASTRHVSDEEVERLRRSLDAERARAERIGRRAAEAPGPEATYAAWDQVVRDRVEAAVGRETARLKDQVDQLRAVVAEKEARLRLLTDAGLPRETPPITAIKGIGPVIAAILAEHGVTTIEHVAALSDREIEELGEVMPVYPGRIRDDDWVGQAQSFL